MLFNTIEELQNHYNFNQTQLEVVNAIKEESKKFSGISYNYFKIGKTKDFEPIISFFELKNINPYDNFLDQYIFYLNKPFFSSNQNYLCRFQIKGNSKDLSLEIVDITSKNYKNLGIGSYGLNNLQEFCSLINYKKIYGEISSIDYEDKNDIEHGYRLLHFYKKNGFQIKNLNGQHGKMIYKVEWLDMPMFIKKNYISDAAAMNNDNFFYGIIETCKNNRLKIEIGIDNGIVEKTFNCYNDEDIKALQKYFDKIIKIHQNR